MRFWWLSLAFWMVLSVPAALRAEDDPTDAPPQGEKEGFVNYYLEGKRDGLQPFWKALAGMQPHEKQFITDYRSAHINKDEKLLNSLFHPASRACDSGFRKPYYDGIREFYLNEYFPESFNLRFIPVQADKRWALKEKLELPAAPTHVLYIEYRDGEYIEGLQRFLREEEKPQKRFYELVKCPSEASMKQMEAEAQKRLAEEEKTAK